MNFTEKLIADQAALAAEVAELKQTLAALTAPKPQPEPVSALGFGGAPVIVRDHARDDEHHEETMERIREQAKARREHEAQELAKRTEGLEDGNWRDPCGIIRDRQGKIVPSGKALEKQLAKAAEHEKAAIAEDLAWRKAVKLPIRVNGYLPEADDE